MTSPLGGTPAISHIATVVLGRLSAITLSMLAAAFLAATARTERERDQKGANVDELNS